MTRRLASVARDVRSTKRRFGIRPVRIGAAFAQQRLRQRRLRRLRPVYESRVAAPPTRARLRLPELELGRAPELPAELQHAAERLRAEADAVLRHEVDYLGSGPVALGPRIDWHRDFKSGYRWPASCYLDAEVTRLDDDSDAKVPWELSRGHQLLTLARAAQLFEDERFAAELEAQLDAWIEENPAGRGINWVNTMEAAIRAVDWLWAMGTLEAWRPVDPGVRERATRSLQAHGRHIAANLEGSALLRGNHFIADVLGLLALGTFLPDDPEAPGWRRFARRQLERRSRAETLRDGVNFEASLPYHGLVLEIFLLAWHIAQLAGEPVSPRFRERLERMLEVSRSTRHPDGRSPVFGDQDSGRVLPAGFARPATHDNLLDLGDALLGTPRWHAAPPDEEVAWILGLDAWRRLAERPARERAPRTAFPDGGLFVLEGGGTHMVVRWGGVGQDGNGGHGHNDVSSYELSRGVPLVVDCGAYLYTADPGARDAFRSARAHNLVVMDGLDLHPLPAGQSFQMPAHARIRVTEWREDRERVVLAGRHDGYRRPGSPAEVTRRIALDRRTGSVEIADEISAAGRHHLESLVHLAPGCHVSAPGARAVDVRRGDAAVTIAFEPGVQVEVEDGWVSSQYGVRERAPVVRAFADAEPPVRIAYSIAPA